MRVPSIKPVRSHHLSSHITFSTYPARVSAGDVAVRITVSQPCLVPLPSPWLSPVPRRFLDIVQSLSSYGSHMFKVKDKKEGVRHIAVGREGVKIFRPDSRLTPSEVQ